MSLILVTGMLSSQLVLTETPTLTPTIKKHSNSMIRHLCHDHELVDPWRFRNPHERLYSWKQHNHPRHSRIDYALINSDANAILSSVGYTDAPFHNDHKIFNINFELGKYQQGQGYFRISNHLYYDWTITADLTDRRTNLTDRLLKVSYVLALAKNAESQKIQYSGQ